MAYRMLRVWRDPRSVDNGGWVRYGVGIMLMELLVVHSGAIFGAYAAGGNVSLAELLILLVLYLVFAGTITLAFKSRDLLKYFLYIMAGRLFAVWVPLLREDAAYLNSRAGVSLILYGAMFLLTILPLPRGGITREIAGVNMKGAGSGVWVDYPHRPIFAGAIYFFLLACCELLLPFGLLHIEFTVPQQWPG